MLDLVLDGARDLRRTLPQVDQHKLDEYLDSVRAVERRIAAIEYRQKEAALEKAGWSVADLDLVEANEAFAAQACAVNKDMGWDPEIVNVNGGAIAIGHPIGASGARILNTLLFEMKRRDAKKGLATLCIGGGMGVAMCLERS